MMFIDVTRYGGMRIQRLAVTAIAYLDEVEGGCAIHLLGGETLRVNEDPAEVEARATAKPAIGPADTDRKIVEHCPPVVAPPAIINPREASQYPAKRAGRGGNGR